MPTTGYDPSSGLVFTETFIRTSKQTASMSLATKCLGRPPDNVPSPSGARSLQRVAMRKLLCNLIRLDAASLHGLPTILLEKIWTTIRRSNLDSIRVWLLFAASPIGTKAFVKTAVFPSSRLSQLAEVSGDVSSRWLTTLHLSVDSISPVALGHVADVGTLRRLHVAHLRPSNKPGSIFDDRIFRSWADLATKSGALSKLDTLFVYQCSDFTNNSLEVLSSFPALDELCTYRCGFKTPSKERQKTLGWRKNRSSGFYAHIKSASYNSSGFRPPGWLALVDAYFTACHSLSSAGDDDRPLLNVTMTGNPHGSSWIDIDETICLEHCPTPGQPPEVSSRRVADAEVLNERPLKKARLPKKLIRFEDTLGM